MTNEEVRMVDYYPGDGRVVVQAEVVSENEDGTLNLRYPHPISGAVDDKGNPAMATADNVREGRGGFQWSEAGSSVLPVDQSAVDAQVESLNNRVETLQSLLDEANVNLDAAKTEIERLKPFEAEVVEIRKAATTADDGDKKAK